MPHSVLRVRIIKLNKKELRQFRKFDKVFNPRGEAVYALLNGGAPLHKGKRKLYTIDRAVEHINDGYNCGYVPLKNFCVIDIDDRTESLKVIEIVKAQGLKTWIIKTTRGIHLYFNRPEYFNKNMIKGRNALEITEYDYLVNNHIVLPWGFNKKVLRRKVLLSTTEVPDMPLWLHPLRLSKTADVLIEFPEHTMGDRNQNLFRHCCRLVEKRFSYEQIAEVATIIAKHVFDNSGDPYRDNELEDTLGSIRKYTPSTYSDGIDLVQFHMLDNNGNIIGVLDDAIVDYLVEIHNIIAIGGDIYIYHDGKYVREPKKVKGFIKYLMIKKFRTYKRILDIFKLLSIDIRIQKTWKQFNGHLDHINFKNGMYNLKTGLLEPHSPEYYSTSQVPHNYHKATVPFKETDYYNFLRVQCKMKLDDIKMILSYHLYSMTVRNNLKAFLMIVGPSNTGKSTLINLIERTVGESNISNVGIQELSQRFNATALFGKMLNSKADDRSDALQNISNLKMITGQDNITHERKGQDIFFFKAFSKLIFSFNQPPLQLEEKSDAFYKRLKYLSMYKVLNLTQNYVDSLFASVEEIIPHLVKYREVLYSGDIPSSRESIKGVISLRDASDTVEAFKNACIRKRDYNKSSSKIDVFNSYNLYCLEMDRTPHGKQIFYRLMEEKGYETVRRKVKGEKVYCYPGMLIKEYQSNG